MDYENSILVVSPSSKALSLEVIQGIISLQSDPRAAYASLSSGPEQPQQSSTDASEATELEDASQADLTVRWSISNRYYTAIVHFEVVLPSETGAMGFETVPEGSGAIMVVIAKEELSSLKSVLAGLSAEDVDVAIVIGAPLSYDHHDGPTVGQTEEERGEEEEDWDAVCLEFGFEYIDSSSLHRASAALQSRMWPSMHPTTSGSNSGPLAPLADRIDERPDLSPSTASRPPTSAIGDFSVWEKRDSKNDDGWTEPFPIASSQAQFPTIALNDDAPPDPSADFEDDFAPFVSAPPPGGSSSTPPSPTEAEIRATEMLLFGPGRSMDSSKPTDPSLEDGGEMFDLERVFARLQGLKAEAGGMDPELRRRLAERVALACERRLDA